MSDAPILIADIGGTHARFAVSSPNAVGVDADVLMVMGLASLEDAIGQYFEMKGVNASDLGGAVLCAAGPVDASGNIAMTNCPWVVDQRALSKAHGIRHIRILNDMSAAALGLLHIGADDLHQIDPLKNNAEPDPTAAKAIVAPGTGLGVSGLIPSAPGKWAALSSEGGNVNLAPQTEREIAVIFHLLRQFGQASAERVLSGPGLETLYMTLAALDGAELKGKLAAVDITNAARRGEALATEAVTMFCAWLGAVAGDVTLTLGARGGLYLGGGILPQWYEMAGHEMEGDLFDEAAFRRRFEAKGPFSEYLVSIPTYLVKRKELALLGCLEEAKNLVA